MEIFRQFDLVLDPGSDAPVRIPGEVLVFTGGAVMAPELWDAIGADRERVFAVMADHRADRSFGNFRETAVAPEELWDAEQLASLRALRDVVDPRHLVQANHELLV